MPTPTVSYGQYIMWACLIECHPHYNVVLDYAVVHLEWKNVYIQSFSRICRHLNSWVPFHWKNRLIRIDGDTVQVQRTEYGRCQTDVDVHIVHIGTASADKAG